MSTPEHAGLAAAVLQVARAAIASTFGAPQPEMPPQAELGRPGAVFVTLLAPDGELRGCIGSIEAHRRLFDDVIHNARAAAAEDPRVMPVTADELPWLQIEVSVLTPLETVPVDSEETLFAALRPGIDGIELSAQGRRAVFIPKMWEQLPDPHDFIRHLRHKAGLPLEWVPGTRLRRFTAETYSETPTVEHA